MTPNDMREHAAALSSLFELDRMADCSDRYFRQVCTAKINAIRADGFHEKLLEAAAAAETTNEEALDAPINKEDE